MLELDCNAYSTGEYSLNTLIGAPNGIISSDKTSGVLPEFLNGRGKGLNVIVFNEIDKASPDLMKRIMEMVDTGKLQAGNGKTYSIGRSLIVFTTNKGANQIFPRGTGTALSRAEIEKRLDSFDDKRVRELFMHPDSTNLYDNSKQLPPETLQRIDAAVAVAPPSEEGAETVAKQEVERLSRALKASRGIEVSLDDAAVKRIVQGVYHPEDGVRELIRSVKSIVSRALEGREKSEPMARGEQLSLRLDGSRDHPAILAKGSIDTRETSVPMPFQGMIGNPMSDPNLRSKLAGLEGKLQERVFDQNDAIRMTVKAIRSRAINPNQQKPVVLGFFGTTGTGKTELAKALAEEHYGDSRRLLRFDMGEVKHEYDFNNIFSPPKGIEGSQTMGRFEQFLNDFPEGGVVLFDEIGNMGTDQKTKTALLQKFYALLDEGEWVSTHGKKYDLRKYSFVFSSNEGQEHLQSLPSDDLRIAQWKKLNNPEQMGRILKEHGWPEALVSRLGNNLAMFQPTTAAGKERIARKLVEKTLSDLKTSLHVDFEVDDDFYKQVADSFFSHSRGARSMEPLANIEIPNLLAEAIFEAGDPTELEGSKIKLRLNDTYSGKRTFSGVQPPERKVVLSLEIAHPGRPPIHVSTEVFGSNEKRLVTRREILKTALHEAGHAVVNDPTLTGQAVDFVTVRGQGGYGGYVRYEPVSGAAGSLTREQAVARIGSMLAGAEMERRYFGPDQVSSGWQQDKEMASQFAQDAVSRYGLTDKALELPVQDGKVVVSSPKTQVEIQKLMREGQQYAERRITERGPEIRQVTARLLRNEQLDKITFEKTVREARTNTSKRILPMTKCLIDSLEHVLSK